MKNDPHLLVSLEPLKAGEDYEALCGRKIVKAFWVWDNSIEPSETLAAILEGRLRFCHKCIADKGSAFPLHGRYLYGAVDGQLGEPTRIDQETT